MGVKFWDFRGKSSTGSGSLMNGFFIFLVFFFFLLKDNSLLLTIVFKFRQYITNVLPKKDYHLS